MNNRKEVGGWGLRHASSLCHASEGCCQKQQSRLAFNLCKTPGVWVCHLKVFFHTQRSQKEEEKGIPCPTRRDESHEGKRKSQKPISCLAHPHHSCRPAPETVKNMTVDRDFLGFSSAGAIWKYSRKHSDKSIRLILLSLNLILKKKNQGGEGRLKEAIERYSCIKITAPFEIRP